MSRNIVRALVAVLTVTCAPSLPAAERVIEEIIVTATKREESIQDVPIAVSAFTGEDLQSRGVQDLYGLQEVSPSISVYSSNSTSNGGTLRIRGVGTTGNNPGLEAAVGTFIDGVYRSRAGLAFSDLVDIDRVEILRGPQGTLFGKNTVAGAVNIITKKPEYERSGSVFLEGGNLEHIRVGGTVTGPLVQDRLAYRLSGSFNEREGQYDDIASNDTYDGRDRWNVKGQLLWTPTPTVDTRLIVDYTDKDESCCPAAYRVMAPTTRAIYGALGATIFPDFTADDSRDVGVNFEPFEEVEDWGVSAESNWSLGDTTLTGIVAYREFEVSRAQDIDFSDADILEPQFSDETFENFSFEARAAGTWLDVDWLLGAYVYTEDLVSDEDIRLSLEGPEYVSRLITIGGDPPAGNTSLAGIYARNPDGSGAGYDAVYSSDTKGWSLFTHNKWHVTERFDLIVGLRYSNEEKEARSIINDAPPGTFINEPHCAILIGSLCSNYSYEKTEDEQEYTGTVKLAYQLFEAHNVYASYSRGYKAGGFNLDQEAVDCFGGTISPSCADGLLIDAARFEPEFSNAWELGAKSAFLDGTLTVNTALFYTRFQDFQLNTFTGLGFFISNLKKVTAKGAEVEAFYTLTDGVYLSVGATYSDARYGGNISEDGASADCSLVAPGQFVSGSVECLENKRLTHAPPWQASASLFVERPIPGTGLVGFGNLNVSHRGDHNTGSSLDPIKEQKGFTLVNLMAGARTANERYEASLWVRNVFDKEYNTVVFDSVFQANSFSTFVGLERTFGGTLRVNF